MNLHQSLTLWIIHLISTKKSNSYVIFLLHFTKIGFLLHEVVVFIKFCVKMYIFFIK